MFGLDWNREKRIFGHTATNDDSSCYVCGESVN